MSDSTVAFHIGPLAVKWFGIIIAAAVIIGYVVAYYRAKARGVDPEHVSNILIIGLVAGFIGARLYYVAFSFNSYRNDLSEIFAIWHGGLAVHGGIIGGIFALVFYSRYAKLDFWYWADLLAPSFILGQAVGRWADYVNQEVFGYPTKLPWAIFIPPEKRPVEFAGFSYFHPTFLYESLWDFAVFVILILLARYQLKNPSKLPAGSILLAYGVFYSFGRFWIESLRTDSLYIGPLRAAQVIGVLVILISIPLFFYRRGANGKVRP